MTAPKLKEAAAARSTRTTRAQPPYHSELSDEYLTALQQQVDSRKPDGFKLTPVSEPGW